MISFPCQFIYQQISFPIAVRKLDARMAFGNQSNMLHRGFDVCWHLPLTRDGLHGCKGIALHDISHLQVDSWQDCCSHSYPFHRKEVAVPNNISEHSDNLTILICTRVANSFLLCMFQTHVCSTYTSLPEGVSKSGFCACQSESLCAGLYYNLDKTC